MLVRPAADYDVKSAFQAVYLAVFIAALWSVVASIFGSELPALQPLEEVIGPMAASDQGSAEFLRFVFITLPKGLFALVIGAHFLRIYLTIEMLEDEEGLFPKYYESFDGVGRAFEFVARLLIVATVSLKVFPIASLNDLSSFLVIFYAAILLWSTIAIRLGKKTWEQSFVGSSLLGFGFAIALYFADRQVTNGGAPWWFFVTVLWLATIVLGGFVGKFWIEKCVPLVRWYFGKLCSW